MGNFFLCDFSLCEACRNPYLAQNENYLYLEKTETILSDTTKFKLLNEDVFKCILRLEDKLNRFLRTVKNKLTEDVYNFLFASGSTPGILYGLPKVHKAGCPIRPILSAIGTFNYNLGFKKKKKKQWD